MVVLALLLSDLCTVNKLNLAYTFYQYRDGELLIGLGCVQSDVFFCEVKLFLCSFSLLGVS